MDINYVAILIVGLATLFVGYFVGLVENRGQKDKKSAKHRTALRFFLFTRELISQTGISHRYRPEWHPSIPD